MFPPTLTGATPHFGSPGGGGGGGGGGGCTNTYRLTPPGGRRVLRQRRRRSARACLRQFHRAVSERIRLRNQLGLAGRGRPPCSLHVGGRCSCRSSPPYSRSVGQRPSVAAIPAWMYARPSARRERGSLNAFSQ